MTRIKYHRSGKNYTSNYLLNYEGKRFIVFIHYNNPTSSDVAGYTMSIGDEKGNIVEYALCMSTAFAKKIARSILMYKYNVRLNEEIRPRS